MSELLIKPSGRTGKIHDISPERANWRYVGFGVYSLGPGEEAHEETGDREAIIVVVEGTAKFEVDGIDLGTLGDRENVFEGKKPWSVYVPDHANWRAVAATQCTLAVGTAPGKGGHAARVIGPDDITKETRGKGSNTRHIHAIAMENQDFADSLLVTEVFTPQGNWSSYPPHRHDEDDYPNITYLEEIYYHRLDPAQGYGVQRVFTEDGELDETLSVSNGDVVLVPKGHHPTGTPYGYDMYYLNIMAGPIRKWRFKNHPDHDWIAQKDKN